VRLTFNPTKMYAEVELETYPNETRKVSIIGSRRITLTIYFTDEGEAFFFRAGNMQLARIDEWEGQVSEFLGATAPIEEQRVSKADFVEELAKVMVELVS